MLQSPDAVVLTSALAEADTLWNIVTQRGCDLTAAPRKSLLRLLGEYCSDAGERDALLHLSSRGGRDAYNAQV